MTGALEDAGFETGDVARLVCVAGTGDVAAGAAEAAGLSNAVTTAIAPGATAGLETLAVAWEALRAGAAGPIVAADDGAAVVLSTGPSPIRVVSAGWGGDPAEGSGLASVVRLAERLGAGVGVVSVMGRGGHPIAVVLERR